MDQQQVQTYHFTAAQLEKLITSAIEGYLEERYVREKKHEVAMAAASTEIFQGLAADRELASYDPTEELKMQLPDRRQTRPR